ncbi:unnamed protein product [Haemonchus placei]|uniref:Cytochrome P450 n=1 Tax=Haemonchus placei TaxID=6290 RepID=A0A0N4X2B1_HAEPC|nr:unnamed protein product [Haemonchus placei]
MGSSTDGINSGPTPLPVIGNLHTIAAREPGYEAYEMWRKQYGPVYTYWLGMTPFVMVSDYKTLKETFVKDGDAYIGKYHFEETTKEYRGKNNFVFKFFGMLSDIKQIGPAPTNMRILIRLNTFKSSGGEYGVVETDGDMWRDHRRFALHVLRDLGLSKDGMEQRVLGEVEAMTEQIKSKKDGKVDMQDIIEVAVGSVINQLLFGYRFDEDHVEEFRELKSMLSRQMKETAHPMALILFMLPCSKHLPYFKGMWQRILSYRDAFYAFFDRQIEAHKKDIDYNSEHTNDYVEAFLKEQKRREADGDSESFKHIQLQNMCLDLWFAGMETTSNTLSWGVVYILNHMDVQAKLHEEMDREIGSSRAITMADKNHLPYTNAVVNVGLSLLFSRPYLLSNHTQYYS